MKIVNKVTLRHMLRNKKRTLVTIIGVIISVAMITAVSTFAASMFDFMQRMIMEESGNWHVAYLDAKASSLPLIRDDEGTKELYLTHDEGFAKLPTANQKNKPYISLKSYDANAFSHNFVELAEGRFPQSDSEIVLPRSLIEKSGNSWNIGDVITLAVGHREIPTQGESGETVYNQAGQSYSYTDGERLVDTAARTFTVVGMIEDINQDASWSPGYTCFTYLDASKLPVGQTVDAYLTVSKLSNSLYGRAENLEEKLIQAGDTGFDMEYHSTLLGYYGCSNDNGFNAAMYSIAVILILIIMVGSISLIYNAFAISVSERSKQFGMLSSVGATKKQKRDSVFFEGGVIGLISIPLGVLAGLGGAAGVFYFINPLVVKMWSHGFDMTFRVVVSAPAIAAAVVFSILTIFISAYIPARRASKITPIEAIRQSTEIKLSSRQVKTSKLTRKLFGFEAELGLKNLKRNRKRYRATVFSLVISIVLFLAVGYFTDAMTGAYTMTQSNVNFDRSLSVKSSTLEKIQPLIDKVSAVEGTKEWARIRSLRATVELPEDSLTDKAQKALTSQEEQRGSPYAREGQNLMSDGSYVSFNDEYFRAFCEENGLNYNQLNDPEHPTALLLNSMQSKANGVYYEGTVLKNGTYTMTLHDYDEPEKTVDLTVVTLDKALPLGFNPAYQVGSGSTLIVSDSIFDKLLGQINNGEGGECQFQYVSVLQPEYQKNDALAEQYDNAMQDIIDSENSYSGLSYTNLTKLRQQNNTMVIVLNVFVYGFIALITAICIANVFNTISTSISVRKREFAMLRSVGMTPKAFNRMLRYESIFYGLKALLYGIPISIIVMWLMYGSLSEMFQQAFVLPWGNLLIVILGVFLIVGASMLYSSVKVKKANIIDALKDETI